MEPVSILQYSYNDFVTNSLGESRDFLWKIMSPSITNESQLTGSEINFLIWAPTGEQV